MRDEKRNIYRERDEGIESKREREKERLGEGERHERRDIYSV